MATIVGFRYARGQLIALAFLVAALLSTAWTSDKGNRYQLVNVYHNRSKEFVCTSMRPVLYGPAYYWSPNDTYVAIEFFSRAVHRSFDLAIIDIKQRKTVATVPVGIEHRKNYSRDNPKWGPHIMIAKWEREDELVYLNEAGELLRAHVSKNSVTKLRQVFVTPPGNRVDTDIGAVCFSAVKPVLYYLKRNQGNGQISLISLDYSANKERVLWSSENSNLAYSKPFGDKNPHKLLLEIPEQNRVFFVLLADQPDGTFAHVLHIVRLDEKQTGKVNYMYMHFPCEFACGMLATDENNTGLWLLGSELLDLGETDGVPDDLSISRLYRYDLTTHELERTGLNLWEDQACIVWWQYLPKRAVHAIVATFIQKEDQYETRLCLYDKTCSKILTSFDLGGMLPGGAFSPSENFLALEGAAGWGFRIYGLEPALR